MSGAPSTTFEIVRQRAVSWFGLRQLAATAAKAIAATIVGPMSGRREIMAALDPHAADLTGPAVRDAVWIDYLADTGDGWNATSSVAWLLGRDALVLRHDLAPTGQPIPCGQDEARGAVDERNIRVECGELMVTGGDQIYPTASAQAYQRRFIDPFRCARFWQEPPRTILAIPGNHDWYDGLTAFIRIFCQVGEARRWVGAWRAVQRRSYFAVRLPHGWWLWGMDAALEDDLDPPQLDYFRRQRERLEPGDKVILCVPGPSWIKRATQEPEYSLQRPKDDRLAIMLRLARGAHGQATVPLLLTGDHHYYARHRANVDGGTRDYIVCGGGGAFGQGTLHVPASIVVDDDGGRDVVAVRQAARFPDRDASTALRWRVLGFPFRNPGFSLLLASLQMIAIWLLHTIEPHRGSEPETSWIEHAMEMKGVKGIRHIFGDVAEAVIRSPALLIATCAVSLAFAVFAISGTPPWRRRASAAMAGLLHAGLQVVGCVVLFWAISQLFAAWDVGMLRRWATLTGAFAGFYLYCGGLFGLYLLIAHAALGMHDQEVFSAQGIEDFKSFLRLRIDANGVTVYPVGLRRIARRWKAAPGVETKGRREQTVTVPPGCRRVFDPVTPLAPQLIEHPFTISGRRG